MTQRGDGATCAIDYLGHCETHQRHGSECRPAQRGDFALPVTAVATTLAGLFTAVGLLALRLGRAIDSAVRWGKS